MARGIKTAGTSGGQSIGQTRLRGRFRMQRKQFALVVQKGKDGEIYNVATGRDHSLEEMVEKLVTISGVQVDLQVDTDRLRPTDIPLFRGDGAKLWSMGWKFTRKRG